MPIDSRGMNSDYIKYFSLEEYVHNIKLLPSLLEHLEYTNCEFDNYMKKLSEYDEEYIINYWIYLLYQELKSSKKIENTKFDIRSLADRNLFFDTLTISHKRLHDLHNFVTEGELQPTYEYRKAPVNVSRFNDDGTEEIFWRGANPEDVQVFMNDFIKIYKHGGTSLLYSNPFLVSSLMHLLFLRIHPYSDGNGRTARIIHNIKFTESVNKLYGTRLKLSPLNISQSILINKITYVNKIDNIYFDVEHDTNENINKWFNFILDMVDEQIHTSTNKLNGIDPLRLKKVSDTILDGGNMRLSRLKK